jgi:hypothetical protein
MADPDPSGEPLRQPRLDDAASLCQARPGGTRRAVGVLGALGAFNQRHGTASPLQQ